MPSIKDLSIGEKMPKPLVSVVMGTFNRKDFLKLTINNLRTELQDIPHELIVIDGGSQDGTVAWLTQQKDIIAMVQHNRGTWRGQPIERKPWGFFMNLGFKTAHGKYALLISDDCLLVPGSLKNAVAQFEKAESSGIKLGGVSFFWRDYPDENRFKVAHHVIGDKSCLNFGLYLTQALKDVGYIDETNFQFYAADLDLCLRVWEKGYVFEDAEGSYLEHYYYANTKARNSNTASHQSDLAEFVKRWKSPECTWVYRDHVDPVQVRNRYRAQHWKNTDYYLVKLKAAIKKLLKK